MPRKVLRLLLPTGKAWRAASGSMIGKWLDGVAGYFEVVRDAADRVALNLWPQTTDETDKWDLQFGHPPTVKDIGVRRVRISGAWKASGGQSPAYIQGVLHAAGFTDVYVHEWWEPGTNPPVARDPRVYLSGPGSIVTPSFTVGGSNAYVGGDKATVGAVVPPTNYPLVNLGPRGSRDPQAFPIPDDPTKWPYFFYIGGATFPEKAKIPIERRAELETLILKISPAHLWIGALLEYT